MSADSDVAEGHRPSTSSAVFSASPPVIGVRFMEDPDDMMPVASCDGCHELPLKVYVDMPEKEEHAIARTITKILRHSLLSEGHTDGWVPIHDLYHEMGFRLPHGLLTKIVREDRKGRLCRSPNFIRAVNGHSVLFPMTSNCFPIYMDDCFHVTTSDKLVSISRTGLKSKSRSGVNLCSGVYEGCGWESRFPHQQKYPAPGCPRWKAIISVAIEIKWWKAMEEYGIIFRMCSNGVVVTDRDIPASCLGFAVPIHKGYDSNRAHGDPRCWLINDQLSVVPDSTDARDTMPVELCDAESVYAINHPAQYCVMPSQETCRRLAQHKRKHLWWIYIPPHMQCLQYFTI